MGLGSPTGHPQEPQRCQGVAELTGNHLDSEREGKELPRGKAWSKVLCAQGAWAEPQTQIFGAGFVPEPESLWLSSWVAVLELLTFPLPRALSVFLGARPKSLLGCRITSCSESCRSPAAGATLENAWVVCPWGFCSSVAF